MTRIEKVGVLALATAMGVLLLLLISRGAAAAPAAGQSPLSLLPTPGRPGPQHCPVVFDCGEELCVYQVGTAIPLSSFTRYWQEYLLDCHARQSEGGAMDEEPSGGLAEPTLEPCRIDLHRVYWEWLVLGQLVACPR